MKKKPVVYICAPIGTTTNMSYLRILQLVGECEGFVVLLPTIRYDLMSVIGFVKNLDLRNAIDYEPLMTSHLCQTMSQVQRKKIRMSDVVLFVSSDPKKMKGDEAFAKSYGKQVVYANDIQKGIDHLSPEHFREWLLSLRFEGERGTDEQIPVGRTSCGSGVRPPTVDEMIVALQQVREKYGDLEIYCDDDFDEDYDLNTITVYKSDDGKPCVILQDLEG